MRVERRGSGAPPGRALVTGCVSDDEAAERLASRGRETAQGYGLARFEDRWDGFLHGFLDG